MPFASAMRILIVDDQLTSRLLIRGGLQDLGVADIEMASNGEEGLNLMKAKPAHLVISDFNMPKLDGLGFLRALRTYPPTQKIGFILLTGKKRQGADRARDEARRQQCDRQAVHDARA